MGFRTSQTKERNNSVVYLVKTRLDDSTTCVSNLTKVRIKYVNVKSNLQRIRF